MKETTATTTPVAAGQIYRTKHGYRLVEQIRNTGGTGLRYALLRPCGPKGRTVPHPILGETPITSYLSPDGSLAPGYVLTATL